MDFQMIQSSQVLHVFTNYIVLEWTEDDLHKTVVKLNTKEYKVRNIYVKQKKTFITEYPI